MMMNVQPPLPHTPKPEARWRKQELHVDSTPWLSQLIPDLKLALDDKVERESPKEKEMIRSPKDHHDQKPERGLMQNHHHHRDPNGRDQTGPLVQEREIDLHQFAFAVAKLAT